MHGSLLLAPAPHQHIPARRTTRHQPGRGRVARLTATLGLAAGLVVLAAVPASAHDELLSSDPADGAVLDAAPSAITLTFSAEVLDVSPTVVVTGPQGAVETTPTVDRTVLTAPLPAGLEGGAYTVAWRVVSADGHPVQGSFGFTLTVAEPSPSPSAEPTTSSPTPTPTPTPSPTAEPSTAAQSPVPTTTPAPAADGTPAAGYVAGAVGLVALVGLVWWLVRRRTLARRPQ